MSRPKLLTVEDLLGVADEQPYHIKYRPQEFGQVIGQGPVVKALEAQLTSKNCPHAFLFTGPSGTGKTTIARIVAAQLGIVGHGLSEIDAATYSKVEDVRRLTETLIYANFGTTTKRLMIVDECHSFSRQAWQALLKPIEESQAGVYWCFCTTELEKVPVTVRTRCACYEMKSVRSADLYDLLEAVAELEELDTSEEVLHVLSQKAQGSPRMALQFLGVAKLCGSRAEALELIEKHTDAVPSVELAKLIVLRKGFTWDRAVKLIRSLEEDQTAENVRLTVVNYCAKVLEGTNTDDRAIWLLKVLEAFAKPFHVPEKRAPLLLAVGALCFDNEHE